MHLSPVVSLPRTLTQCCLFATHEGRIARYIYATGMGRDIACLGKCVRSRVGVPLQEAMVTMGG